MDCRKCGAHLTTDEKAIYMKLVSRNASRFSVHGLSGGSVTLRTKKRLKSASDIIGNLAIVCCFDKQSPSLP